MHASPSPSPSPSAGGQRVARRALRPNLGSPKTAREFTRRTFSAWDLDGLYNDVVVVVSELVTNALCHGLNEASYSALARPVQLVLMARERRVLAAVVDPSDKTPVLGSTKHFAES